MLSTPENRVNEVEAAVFDSLVAQALEPTESSVRNVLTQIRMPLSTDEVQRVMQNVEARLVGYGELRALITAANTDVLVNGPNSVWTDGPTGLVHNPVSLHSEEHVRQLAMRLAGLAGRRLDEAQPFVDGLLPDGVRLQAALPPVSASGTCISLRLPAKAPLPLEDWKITPHLLSRLQPVLEGKASFVISGSTGAGKTSLLRSVISAWQLSRRVVCVEDVQELNLRMPNVVSLQTRQANAEGAGAVSLSALIRHVLRMRPDAIVVGEVRGDEVAQWLLAISSGHPGSATTVHADSAVGAVRRLLLLAELGGIPRISAVDVVAAAVAYVIHVQRVEGRRVVVEVASVNKLLDTVRND